MNERGVASLKWRGSLCLQVPLLFPNSSSNTMGALAQDCSVKRSLSSVSRSLNTSDLSGADSTKSVGRFSTAFKS